MAYFDTPTTTTTPNYNEEVKAFSGFFAEPFNKAQPLDVLKSVVMRRNDESKAMSIWNSILNFSRTSGISYAPLGDFADTVRKNIGQSLTRNLLDPALTVFRDAQSIMATAKKSQKMEQTGMSPLGSIMTGAMQGATQYMGVKMNQQNPVQPNTQNTPATNQLDTTNQSAKMDSMSRNAMAEPTSPPNPQSTKMTYQVNYLK